MGSNSNRNDTEAERIAKYVQEVYNTKDTSDDKFQISTGAKIRGEMGIEKGNAFIKAINDAKK